jgi:uncharacterized protein YjbI with pentapeptide repeats
MEETHTGMPLTGSSGARISGVSGPMCAERTYVEGGSAGLVGAKRAGLGAVDLSGADLREMDLETTDLTDC